MSSIITKFFYWVFPALKTIAQEGESKTMGIVQEAETEVKAVATDVAKEWNVLKDDVQEIVHTLEADALKAIAELQSQIGTSKLALVDFRDRLAAEIKSKTSALAQVEYELAKLEDLVAPTSAPAAVAPAASVAAATTSASGWTNPPANTAPAA